MPSRTRSRNEGPVYQTGVIKSNGSDIPSTRRTFIASYKEEEMIDHTSPDFWNRIKNGEVINQPCQLISSSRESGLGVYTQNNGVTYYDVSGTSLSGYWGTFRNFIPPTAEEEVDTTYHSQTAKQKCLAFVDSTPYGFAEDLGEIRETISLIRDPLKSARAISRAFNKDVIGFLSTNKGRDRVRSIANIWLDYRNGFSPLIRSAEGFIEAFQTKVKRPDRRTARGLSSTDNFISENPSYSYSGQVETWQVLSAFTYEARAYIIYEVSNPINDWRYKYGLRTKDIPETLWALAPLSFMVDRVVNISRILGGIRALSDPSVSMLGAGIVEKKTTETSWSIQTIDHPSWFESVSGDSVIDKHGSYQRSIWSPGLADSLQAPVVFAGLTKDVNSTLDLTALIVQGLTKF